MCTARVEQYIAIIRRRIKETGVAGQLRSRTAAIPAAWD